MAGSLKKQSDDDLSVNHEINVTPFIDVMLVLLIIFMVAAPLSTVDVAVDLPASNAQPQPRPKDPLFLTIKSDLALAIGNDTISRGSLKGSLDAKTQGDTEQRVFVRADKVVPYGEIMEVMNLLRTAGYLKIGLVGLEGAPGAGAPQPTAAGKGSSAGTLPSLLGAGTIPPQPSAPTSN